MLADDDDFWGVVGSHLLRLLPAGRGAEAVAYAVILVMEDTRAITILRIGCNYHRNPEEK